MFYETRPLFNGKADILLRRSQILQKNLAALFAQASNNFAGIPPLAGNALRSPGHYS
jgi:hypothetical protein